MSCGKGCPTHVMPGLEGSRHNHQQRVPRPKIVSSVLGAIGDTPLVRLDRFAEKNGLKCELLAKCEFFNSGGSIKDRIGLRMIEEAEKSGRIKPGDTLIEPTSGNTGIGLALAAAVKGYRMIITLPMKMSLEKVNVLKALGAEIIRTPTEAAWDSPESHISVALALNKQIPNSHILDQYKNPYNPLAHYDSTAEEILEACDGDLDVLVITAGTGGHLTGLAGKIKERCPKCVIVGVDPHGSILALPEDLNSQGVGTYKVEGIGYDFIPDVCHRQAADEWVKTRDKESFLVARDLIRTEGLLCGGSTGTAMWAALEYCKHNDVTGKRVVVICPDSIRNYMSKHLDPDWMVNNDFADASLIEELENKQAWWSELPVTALKLTSPHTITPDVTIGKATALMSQNGYGQLPVVSRGGAVVGTVTEGNLLAKLGSGAVKPTDPVTKALYKEFTKVEPGCPLKRVSRIFDKETFVLVTAKSTLTNETGESEAVELVVGVVTRIDLLSFISSRDE
eukprot:c19993_g1_i1.p1 GENE.c19993_g1_i1~~c19993_g1_i1.p1  ORF type:complete len:508 (-),score=127.96 c19993_g1_i1:135-1658(-)